MNAVLLVSPACNLPPWQRTLTAFTLWTQLPGWTSYVYCRLVHFTHTHTHAVEKSWPIYLITRPRGMASNVGEYPWIICILQCGKCQCNELYNEYCYLCSLFCIRTFVQHSLPVDSLLFMFHKLNTAMITHYKSIVILFCQAWSSLASHDICPCRDEILLIVFSSNLP